MSAVEQANPSRVIREAMEKAIAWSDVEIEEMSGEDIVQRHDDLALALGILHKWREEES